MRCTGSGRDKCLFRYTQVTGGFAKDRKCPGHLDYKIQTGKPPLSLIHPTLHSFKGKLHDYQIHGLKWMNTKEVSLSKSLKGKYIGEEIQKQWYVWKITGLDAPVKEINVWMNAYSKLHYVCQNKEVMILFFFFGEP